MSPEQKPAVLVVGERDGEVALLSEERDLLHLRQSELNKHRVTITPRQWYLRQELPASKKIPFRKFLSFLF